MIISKLFSNVRSSIVNCSHTAEHLGIYLGNIEIFSPSRFTDNITTLDTDIFILVNQDGYPISCSTAASHARSMIGSNRNYNLLLDNYHQFSAGCIRREFENVDNFLWFAKETFYQEMGRNVKWQR